MPPSRRQGEWSSGWRHDGFGVSRSLGGVYLYNDKGEFLIHPQENGFDVFQCGSTTDKINASSVELVEMISNLDQFDRWMTENVDPSLDFDPDCSLSWHLHDLGWDIG